MSELRVPSESHAGRSISPASKRQRTADGYSSRDGSGYNSAVDSGDELFDHLTTPQTSKHFTQPTQLLDRNDAQSSPGSAVSPEVQVPVSSPFRQQQASAAMLQSPTSKVSRVASLMAPAGTAFRAPVIPTQSSVVKKSVVIDLSDDDGPHYKGGSSDDDGQSRAGIKPSTFVSRPGNTSLSASRTDSDNAGTGGLGRPPSKFNDIVSNYRYNSDKATTIGNSSGSKSSSSILSAYLSAGGNRSSGTGSMAGALHSKPHVQSKPSRAMPVDEVRTSDASNELEMRRKIFRLKQMNPAISVVQARNALVSCKGSVDDAAAQLMAPPIEISDDENETSRPQMHALDTQMKHQLKAPIKSIQERYSSTQHAKKAAQPAATPEKKPRKRLQQGRRQPSPSSSAVRSPPVPAPSPPKPVHILSDQDSADSGIASESEDDPLLEGRLLNFINKCKAEDLADLANVKVGVAELILAQRPFKNLDAARRVTDGTTLKSGKRSNKAPIGEKVIQTAVDMWSGYEAVDALVAKCEQLGKPLTEEISKWGFDVFGAAKTGELEMVSLDDGSDSPRDSGIGTPSSKAASTNGDAGEDDIRTASQHKKHRQVTFLKKPALMNPDITLKDYQVVGLNWLALLYKHKLSCILADDMGLGKTCQVIAFLSHIVETGVSGPHLVIVPASTLENWLREFQLFSPNLVVEPYYGLQAERFEASVRMLEERDRINVVVSTYDFAAKTEDNRFMRQLRPTVCVYDEGHVLKNPKSQRYERLIRIPAQFKLLLTGTPLQNNLLELAALLGFILPGVFRERQEELEYIFKNKATTRDSDHAALLSAQRIARAKSMLTPFVLRRKKDQVLKSMPPKTCRVEYCELHPSQATIYNELRDKALERARMRIDGVKIPKDTENNNPLMQLRKAAIHPLLFRRHFTDAKIDKMLALLEKHDTINFAKKDHKNRLKEMLLGSDWTLHLWCLLEYSTVLAKFDVPDLAWLDSGKVSALVRLLEEYKANGDRVLIFSQFTLVLNILEAVLETTKIQFTRIDGSTKVNERQTLIDDFRDNVEITAFLLSTGAGGTGLNLMYANKVIIFDGSFNPQDDIQAENRAHRVGQTRPVEVVRLVTKGTIEEQIYALGQSKLVLDSRVSGEDAANLKGEELVSKMLLAEAEGKEKAGTPEVEAATVDAPSEGVPMPVSPLVDRSRSTTMAHE